MDEFAHAHTARTLDDITTASPAFPVFLSRKYMFVTLEDRCQKRGSASGTASTTMQLSFSSQTSSVEVCGHCHHRSSLSLSLSLARPLTQTRARSLSLHTHTLSHTNTHTHTLRVCARVHMCVAPCMHTLKQGHSGTQLPPSHCLVSASQQPGGEAASQRCLLYEHGDEALTVRRHSSGLRPSSAHKFVSAVAREEHPEESEGEDDKF